MTDIELGLYFKLIDDLFENYVKVIGQYFKSYPSHIIIQQIIDNVIVIMSPPEYEYPTIKRWVTNHVKGKYNERKLA